MANGSRLAGRTQPLLTLKPTADDQRAHLTMIQGIINRMGGNSFTVKGWSASLVAAILTFAISQHQPKLGLVALVPIAAFWAMDASYLALERAYRRLYDAVRRGETEPFDLRPARLTVSERWQAAVSWSATMIHGMLAAVTLLLTLTLTYW
jgi:hypothetical protein